MATGNLRRNTVQLLAKVVAFLAVVQSVPLIRALGFHDARSQGGVSATGKYTASEAQVEGTSEGIELRLMQFHHDESPYAKPNLSLEDRVLIAAKSSQARAEYFNTQISRNRNQKFSSKAVFSSPVSSDEGSYLMKFTLGTPGRTFVSIADTGSDLVWVQCAPCTNCYSQPDPVFNPKQSSSYSAASCSSYPCTALPSHSCTTGNTCAYKYGYGDQSTTQGVFSYETITMTSTSGGDQSFSNFGFGCGNQNQGLFTGTDGLVGLGGGPVSLIGQLGSQFGNVFSYCLVSFYSSTSKTSPLLLGSTGGSVVYTPLVTNSANPTFYYVNLMGILVNGNPLTIPQGTFAIDASGDGGFILDSGTTVTQLQEAAYTALVDSLASLISYPRVDGSSIGFDLCYTLAGESSPTVPVVTFQFLNMNVDLPGDNLFLAVDNAGDYCLAMQGSSFGFGVYGNVQQQNFNIAYDVANRRVGFALANC